MRRKYTHIFFDLDNTLWDFEKNSKHAMFSTFTIFKLQDANVDFEVFFEVYSKHNHALWAAYRKKEVGKKELIRKRFQNTLDDLGIKGIDPEKMNAVYLDEMPKQNYLIEGALDVLHYLKKRGYLLYVITNGFKEVQYKKLKSAGLEPFFIKVFISEVVKTPKPGREIFEYAIKSANAKKANSIMIGDDWDVDVVGALKFGLDAIHFENKMESSYRLVTDANNYNSKAFKIGTLAQLLKFL